MSTTSSSPQETRAADSAIVPTTGRTIQGWILILLVIVAGACSLAVELSASRLLAPYFGTSLFGPDDRFIKRYLEHSSSSLLVTAASSMINQNSAHSLRGYCVEVSPILPSHILVVG